MAKKGFGGKMAKAVGATPKGGKDMSTGKGGKRMGAGAKGSKGKGC